MTAQEYAVLAAAPKVIYRQGDPRPNIRNADGTINREIADRSLAEQHELGRFNRSSKNPTSPHVYMAVPVAHLRGILSTLRDEQTLMLDINKARFCSWFVARPATTDAPAAPAVATQSDVDVVIPDNSMPF